MRWLPVINDLLGIESHNARAQRLMRDVAVHCGVKQPKITADPDLGLNASIRIIPFLRRVNVGEELLRELNDKEVRAILTHELGHVRRLEPISLQVALETAKWRSVAAGVTSLSDRPVLLRHVLVACALHLIGRHAMRAEEYSADEYAAKHSNAMSYLSALTHLSSDEIEPSTRAMKAAGELLSTHPWTSKRLERVRAIAGLD